MREGKAAQIGLKKEVCISQKKVKGGKKSAGNCGGADKKKGDKGTNRFDWQNARSMVVCIHRGSSATKLWVHCWGSYLVGGGERGRSGLVGQTPTVYEGLLGDREKIRAEITGGKKNGRKERPMLGWHEYFPIPRVWGGERCKLEWVEKGTKPIRKKEICKLRKKNGIGKRVHFAGMDGLGQSTMHIT